MSGNAKEASLAQDVLKPLVRAYRKTRPLGSAGLIEQLLYILLQRWFPVTKVDAVLKALRAEFVDMNEVRVSHMTEIDGILESVGLPNAHEAAQGVKDLLTGYHLLRNDLDEDYFEGLAPEERVSFLSGIPVLEPWMIHYIMLSREPEGSALYQVDLSRVAQRVGLIPRTSSPRKVVEGLLALELGADLLGMQLYLIRVGTEVCGSRSYDCAKCRLQKLCAVGRKTLKQIAAKAAKAQQRARAAKTAKKKKKAAAKKKPATRKRATSAKRKSAKKRTTTKKGASAKRPSRKGAARKSTTRKTRSRTRSKSKTGGKA
jgi:endonuclease III